MNKTTIAICGAGIAGVATAYYLLQKNRDIEVIVIDKNQPLSFTTSKSGENFRNYWPQQPMRQFMNHSIDLMDELQTKYGTRAFEMTYSGYHFITHHKDKAIFGIDHEAKTQNDIEHITNPNIIQHEYPHLDRDVQKVSVIKKAGKIDVYALGSLLINEAKKRKAKYVTGEIIDINKSESAFQIQFDSGESIEADKVVIATGPFINHIATMLGLEFPIFNTVQNKFIMPDPKQLIPKHMPFSIYADEQYINWSEEEKAFFASEEKFHYLLGKFPGGLHIKSEGAGVKIGWAFQRAQAIPNWDIPKFELFPQIVLKGVSRFIPALNQYADNIPTPLIEFNGYYTRTKENWPLIGSTNMSNVYVAGALAGYGTMAACATGELCAQYICEENDLPDYAAYFHPKRYSDVKIMEALQKLDSDGQL